MHTSLSMEIIPLADALKVMATKQPCTITYVTADRKRGTGGEIIDYVDVRQTSKNYKRSTRNIMLPNGHKRTIHIRLIIFFNSKKVIW